MLQRIRAVSLVLSLLVLVVPTSLHAQTPAESRDERATVQSIDRMYEQDGNPQAVFTATLDDGSTVTVDTGNSYTEGLRYDISPGDRVVLQLLPNADGTYSAYLSDVVRTWPILILAILFCAVVVGIGLWRGWFALIGLAFTFGALFLFALPQILAGKDPVWTAAIACVAILAVNMHLAHGFSRRTAAAFGATVIGVVLAAVIGKLSIAFAHLSGLASEEAAFLFWQEHLAPTGILLAGIMLGACGVLDDIAITQSETIAELKEANPNLNRKELFIRGMRIGRHHIASTVNTLVLAYVGASLPLFLLFLAAPNVTFESFINSEGVAEEIIRTLAGTFALMLTVPIATWLATVVSVPQKPTS